MNNKNTKAHQLGYVLGVLIITCAAALIVALTVKSIQWILF